MDHPPTTSSPLLPPRCLCLRSDDEEKQEKPNTGKDLGQFTRADVEQHK